MKSAGYDVRESNPFEAGQIFGTPGRAAAPIVGRVQMMWESMRGAVMKVFPESAGTCRKTRTPICVSSMKSIRATRITRCPSRDIPSRRH